MNRRLRIYLMGVAIGCVLLLFVPRPGKKERQPHPWHAQTAPVGYYPRTVTDDTGQQLVLERQPRLLVSLAPSISDILVHMDMGDHLVGVTRWCDNPELADTRRVGDMNEPNIEEILALRPDCVIGTEMTPAPVYERMRAVGLQVIIFKHQGLDDVLEDAGRLSSLLGVPALGLGMLQNLEARREAVQQQVNSDNRPRVLLLYDFQTLGSAGKGTWVGDLIEEAGGINVAATAESPWPRLSLEGILAAEPEVLILAGPTDPEERIQLERTISTLDQHPVWKHVPAVQTGRVAILPPNAASIPGPRMVTALEALAAAIAQSH